MRIQSRDREGAGRGDAKGRGEIGTTGRGETEVLQACDLVLFEDDGDYVFVHQPKPNPKTDVPPLFLVSSCGRSTYSPRRMHPMPSSRSGPSE